MTRHLRYIILLIPVFFGGIYFNFFEQNNANELTFLQEKLQALKGQNLILKDTLHMHGLENLKLMKSHHQSFKRNPKEYLKTWAHKHHLTINEISSPSKDTFECAFSAVLDADV